ncbi:MAG: hypothetical protein ACRDK9_12550, partial [Solirubrobacterales bacterium]
ALPDFIPPPVVVDAEARHRRDGIGRVGIYLATGGEFLVAAVSPCFEKPRADPFPVSEWHVQINNS